MENDNRINDPYFLTDEKKSSNAYSQLLHQIIDDIVSSINNDKAYIGLSPQELKEAIHVENLLPEKGLGLGAVSSLLKEKVLPYFLKTSSTDYLAHLHGPSLIETIAAELIISTFNQSMDSWDQSPVATEIELEVIDMLCKLFGYSKGSDGSFTSGGSQSNLTGIMLARDWFCNTKLCHDVKKHGLPDNYKKLRLYTSEISHFSMEKSCHLLGLGYEGVVKVPVDSNQKMDVAELERLMVQDVEQGNIPFCVVATIGTTDYGSIDSVKEISQLCKKYGVWLHADAAYGSGVIMSEKYRCRIGDLSLCDSITVDFHKMFVMPISCSAILVKNGNNFEALTLHADYLNREEDEEDGYTNLVGKSMQTTRRFDALKVWLAFQVRGKDGWSEMISTCIENAEYFYTNLASNPKFEVTVKPEISSVVFRVLPQASDNLDADTLNKKIRRQLIHQQGVVIGQTVYNGFVHLKFTLLNPLLTHDKLDELIALILNMAENA